MRAFIVSLILIVAAATGAVAQGKVTIDPNAGGAKEPEEAAVETDARLDQKVTYEAKQKSVLAILNDLSQSTGVAFKAGQNTKDWESRDRKMNIFAKDVPLRELMASMARVMKFRWTRDKTGETYSYRFHMTRRTKLDADERRQKQEEETQIKRQERRLKALEAYGRLESLSPEDLDKLKKDNPFLYALANAGITSSLGKFFAESPAVVDAIANGQALSLAAGSLSPAARQGLLKGMQNAYRFEASFSGRERTFPDGITNNIEQAAIRVNQRLDDMRNAPGSGFVLGEIEMRHGNDQVELPILDPESDTVKMIGKMILQSQEEGRPINELAHGRETEFMKVMQEEVNATESGEPVSEHPDEPALHAKIKFKADSNRLPDVEAALAKESKLAVVSDCFGAPRGMTRFSGEESEIRDVLDKIAEGYFYNWEKHGDIIEFRDRKWYEKLAALIPDEWLENWKNTLMTTGTLDLADLAQIASLTREQFTTNIQPDETLSRSGLMGIYHGNRDFLKIYGALSESQQAAIFGAAGFDVRTLSPELWPPARKLIDGRNPSFLMNADAHIMLLATRKQEGKQFNYEFSLRTSDDLPPIEWKLSTPRYVEFPPQPHKQEVPKPEPPKDPEKPAG